MNAHKCPECGKTAYTAISEEKDRRPCPYCYDDSDVDSILPSDKADRIMILLFIAGMCVLIVFLVLVQIAILTR